MTQRIVTSEHERDMLIKLLRSQQLPFTASIAKGKNRSVEQNRLQRLWINEAAEQLGDRTAEEVRAYLKLTIGVPIMRAGHADFCEKYDRVVKSLPYEDKLALMAEPLDFPVTRLMTTRQKTEYLEGCSRHLAEQGVILTSPYDPTLGQETA